jgi:hypothetical protein
LSSKAVNTSQLLEILRSQDSDTQKEVIFNTYETKVLLCLAKKRRVNEFPSIFRPRTRKVSLTKCDSFENNNALIAPVREEFPPTPIFVWGQKGRGC